MEKVYRVLEIGFWGISGILCALLWVNIAYQLSVLYVPYWWSSSHFRFPEYFYRVYGEGVETLQFEHYGYLLAALVVGGIGTRHLYANHPWHSALKSKSV